MHHAYLSPSSQFILYVFLALACSVLVARALSFLRRENAGTLPIYPPAWSAAQCQALEYFRMLVGLALVPLWGFFIFTAPADQIDRPFGYVGLVLLIFLISMSSAWVLLLIPRNWKKFGAISRSFGITITFLIVWWGTAFTATAWMLVQASAPPSDMFTGAYAARGVLPNGG